MLGNCTQKMQLIFSTTNHWPQNEIDDQKGLSIASTGTTRVMEKQPSQLEQKPQEALKCPRCDSSNTKFCYYNNYSLSQPRHFCKACKRYWTRGGTLRNVPVGGGCRKNKKIKRSISAVDPPSLSSSPTTTSSNPNSIQPHNPLFYGLPTTNPNSELSTLPYPNFNSRVSTVDAVSGFDPQPQMSCFGLGFSISSSSGVLMPTTHEVGNNGNYQNEFPSYNKHIIQDVVTSSNSLPSSYSMFGSSTNSPTIASLLGSSLPQQKFFNNGGFQGLVPFEELQMGGNMNMKEVKREEVRNLNFPNNCQNQIEQTNPSDPTLYWSANGAWLDPTNMGSSVPSLI